VQVSSWSLCYGRGTRTRWIESCGVAIVRVRDGFQDGLGQIAPSNPVGLLVLRKRWVRKEWSATNHEPLSSIHYVAEMQYVLLAYTLFQRHYIVPSFNPDEDEEELEDHIGAGACLKIKLGYYLLSLLLFIRDLVAK